MRAVTAVDPDAPFVPSGTLRRVSRTFALSIRLLPAAMRRPVELAYLLARAADTIADRGDLAADRRRGGLEALRGALAAGRLPAPLPRPRGDAHDPTAAAEADLLDAVPRLLAGLAALDEADRADVVTVCDRLISTMLDELATFAGASGHTPVALADARALRDYTEGIAGCVGAFWTALIARHAVPLDEGARRALAIEGRRYGRGLQLVNILRDGEQDARRGRVYLPADELRAAGLGPESLAEPAAAPALAPVRARWAARSRHGLLAGIAYAARLPVRPFGVRVATLLPAAIGLRTLSALERRGFDASGDRVRISRQQLRATIVRSAMACLTPGGPRRLARRPRRPV
ncbi:MAG: hypothetical protein D6738_00285 [Acidobacteria bacterium]|nr:MAG: hypothetical protein D6738_00285 [Acidobacteriota bacterium]